MEFSRSHVTCDDITPTANRVLAFLSWSLWCFSGLISNLVNVSGYNPLDKSSLGSLATCQSVPRC